MQIACWLLGLIGIVAAPVVLGYGALISSANLFGNEPSAGQLSNAYTALSAARWSATGSTLVVLALILPTRRRGRSTAAAWIIVALGVAVSLALWAVADPR